MPMTLTELSVYMKEQEQLRIEKEREDGKNYHFFFTSSGCLWPLLYFESTLTSFFPCQTK